VSPGARVRVSSEGEEHTLDIRRGPFGRNFLRVLPIIGGVGLVFLVPFFVEGGEAIHLVLLAGCVLAFSAVGALKLDPPTRIEVEGGEFRLFRRSMRQPLHRGAADDISIHCPEDGGACTFRCSGLRFYVKDLGPEDRAEIERFERLVGIAEE